VAFLSNRNSDVERIVTEATKGVKITLVYLPGYSPNLNLIEQYWGFLKKRVLVNHYYETMRDLMKRYSNFPEVNQNG
jgi:transposase